MNTQFYHHGPQRIGYMRFGADNRSLAVLSTRLTQFVRSFATKDSAEPSIVRSSDAGAVPAASTGTVTWATRKARQDHLATASLSGLTVPAGANQDRRRSDDRNCTRHDTAVIGSTQNCGQRQRSRRTAPRGVSEAAPAGAWQQNPATYFFSASAETRGGVESKRGRRAGNRNAHERADTHPMESVEVKSPMEDGRVRGQPSTRCRHQQRLPAGVAPGPRKTYSPASSAVERLFCKQRAGGSNPSLGSTVRRRERLTLFRSGESEPAVTLAFRAAETSTAPHIELAALMRRRSGRAAA